MSSLTLKDTFNSSTRQDWRELAEKGLKGAALDTLTSRTEDDLKRGPLFDESDRPVQIEPLPRTDAPLLDERDWHICAPIIDTSRDHANSQLLDDLEGGCSAVFIHSGGLIERRADLRRLLEGVYTDLVPIIFAPNHSGARMALDIDELSDATVLLGYDPLGERPDSPEAWRAFTVDGASVHEAGGTDGLELALTAAEIAECFRKHGSEPAHANLSLLLSSSTDAHLSLVKIRAARRLYARIADAFGIEGATVPIQAMTSLRMMQSEDAWTNLLRTMSAGFGAVTGGADYVILRPFTETPEARRLGGATGFAHRIARNQQLMMMEESHLGQVKDPAFGSYFHERLTEDLAQSAWAKFQSIEAAGGVEAYRNSGDYDANLETARAKRDERDAPILGVTLHPAPDVRKPEVRS